MTSIKQTWPVEAICAVSVKTTDCKLDIQGTDEDLITLEGDVDEHRSRDFRIDAAGQHLKINIGHSQLTLKLPREKPFVIDCFSGRSDIKVNQIQARMRIFQGKGHILIENCRGLLTIGSGHADIQVKHLVQADMPGPFEDVQQPPAETKNRSSQDWLHWGESEWENWGEGLGEKIGWWAMDLSRFFERSSFLEKNPGLSVQTGSGDVELEDIEARACFLRLSRGNLKLDRAYLNNAEINLSRGNIECKSIVPMGDWILKTIRGNIQLSIPSNVGARLDMATRNGNIHSEIPVVRVTRQGPESYGGQRMVGTIGPDTGGNVPELRLAAIHGNIEIVSQSPVNINLSGPESEDAPAPLSDVPIFLPAVSSTISSQPRLGPNENKETAASVLTEPASDTRLEILKALSQGKISVSEADRLLRSSGS
jgi:hypothetical protein